MPFPEPFEIAGRNPLRARDLSAQPFAWPRSVPKTAAAASEPARFTYWSATPFFHTTRSVAVDQIRRRSPSSRRTWSSRPRAAVLRSCAPSRPVTGTARATLDLSRLGPAECPGEYEFHTSRGIQVLVEARLEGLIVALAPFTASVCESQLPALSVVRTTYWSALPFFRTSRCRCR